MIWEDLAAQDVVHRAHRLVLLHHSNIAVRVVGYLKRSFLRQFPPQRIGVGLEGELDHAN